MSVMSAPDVARLLPEPDRLREHCLALAVLEAILCPEEYFRYHAFDAAWGPGEQLASMRNGSGDEHSVVFTPAGVYLRGFDHESYLSPYAEGRVWPGVVDSVPAELRHCVTEPAFCDDGVPTLTAAIWRLAGDTAYRTGEIDFPPGLPDADGADWLFRSLTDTAPEAYAEFASDYYGTEVDLDAVRHVFALRPLTEEVVRTLNPELTLDELAEDLKETGYPTGD